MSCSSSQQQDNLCHNETQIDLIKASIDNEYPEHSDSDLAKKRKETFILYNKILNFYFFYFIN